jgi:Sec-independent protein translocase protein TatA
MPAGTSTGAILASYLATKGAYTAENILHSEEYRAGVNAYCQYIEQPRQQEQHRQQSLPRRLLLWLRTPLLWLERPTMRLGRSMMRWARALKRRAGALLRSQQQQQQQQQEQQQQQQQLTDLLPGRCQAWQLPDVLSTQRYSSHAKQCLEDSKLLHPPFLP